MNSMYFSEIVSPEAEAFSSKPSGLDWVHVLHVLIEK